MQIGSVAHSPNTLYKDSKCLNGPNAKPYKFLQRPHAS